jgi:hypothetical protein
MAAEVMTAPEGRIIHKTYAVLSGAAIPQRVHVTQYDESLPVIACTLYKDGQLYTIPDGASVRLRMNKNGLPVYHEAIGIDDARHVVYLEITAQMTVLYGEFAMVVEVETSDGKTAGTSYLRLIVRQNPVQNPELDNIPDYTANSNRLTAEGVKKLQDESSTQQKAIEDKGKKTLESIPADYSTLSGKVDKNTSGISELKEDLDDNYDILTKKANILTTKLEKAYIRSDGSIGSSDLQECSRCDVTDFVNLNIIVIAELSQTEFPYVAFYDLPLEETVWNVPKENAIEFFFPQFQGKCRQNFKVPSNAKTMVIATDKNSDPIVVSIIGGVSTVSPEFFGATGDGLNDDTDALKKAIKSGMPIVGNGIYSISSELVIVANDNTVYDFSVIVNSEIDTAITIINSNKRVKNASFHLKVDCNGMANIGIKYDRLIACHGTFYVENVKQIGVYARYSNDDCAENRIDISVWNNKYYEESIGLVTGQDDIYSVTTKDVVTSVKLRKGGNKFTIIHGWTSLNDVFLSSKLIDCNTDSYNFFDTLIQDNVRTCFFFSQGYFKCKVGSISAYGKNKIYMFGKTSAINIVGNNIDVIPNNTFAIDSHVRLDGTNSYTWLVDGNEDNTPELLFKIVCQGRTGSSLVDIGRNYSVGKYLYTVNDKNYSVEQTRGAFDSQKLTVEYKGTLIVYKRLRALNNKMWGSWYKSEFTLGNPDLIN